MTNLKISNLSLGLAALMVVITLIISYYQKLHLNKEIIWSIFRAIIQLIIIGFALRFIFKVNNFFLTIVMMLFIVVNAAYNGKKRAHGIPHAFMISFVGLFCGTAITVSLMLLTKVMKPAPFQTIPVTGMIAGNSMAAIGLVYSSLYQSFSENSKRVEEMLALGASPKLAAGEIVRQALHFGLQPTIDSVRMYGLVQLPGMMSGLIMAGLDPVEAIKYQILVVFMLFCSTGISTSIAGFWAYKEYFDQNWRLVIPETK
ncbi:ABC transporter permease [Xylocopilactobacillus apicola]|uniref:Iron export ABC transporter permease subunit FetB n=1 Tax=Xylocopilactobacillus apicola TaxID=2932184 RepID=A0AAU9DSH0_9LACO|nr:iron export ABC transporter permease subunit FetB [Xylocopilactobacillus apicola]BDR58223.1 iron export ABC transporter permease subunit FetB [Xylocopilactobacillus apicola]